MYIENPFRPGDKVLLRSNSFFEELPKDKDGDGVYGNDFFPKEMAKYCGMTAIVEHASTDNSEFYIDIDNGKYSWAKWMIAGVVRTREVWEDMLRYAKLP